jgi:hypothetical protein
VQSLLFFPCNQPHKIANFWWFSTKLIEVKKFKNKKNCSRFFPEEGEKQNFGYETDLDAVCLIIHLTCRKIADPVHMVS